MSVDCISIDEIPGEVWSRARRSGPAGVFYRPKLLQLWRRVYGWSSIAFTDGRALLIGFVKSTPFGKLLFSLPLGWYGGFVGSEPDRVFVEQTLAALRRRRFIQENIVQFGNLERHYHGSGYRRRELTTHILDLTAEVSFSAGIRRNIEKSQQHRVSVRPIPPSCSSLFLNILKEHQEITGKKRRLGRDFYAELLRISFQPDSGLAVIGGWQADDLVAWQIYLETESDQFYFDGAGSRKGRKLLAGFHLSSHQISDAGRRGIRRLNFGATPTEHAGLVRFKEGWGSVPVKYHELYRAAMLKRVLDRIRR